jgi:hypothetical protein
MTALAKKKDWSAPSLFSERLNVALFLAEWFVRSECRIGKKKIDYSLVIFHHFTL